MNFPDCPVIVGSLRCRARAVLPSNLQFRGNSKEI
jgi:hypothetical protein